MKIIPNAIMMKNVTNLFSDLLINDRISFPKLFICKNHNNLGQEQEKNCQMKSNYMDLVDHFFEEYSQKYRRL